jgi:hypothetical protein
MTQDIKNNKTTIAGIVFTILATIGFVWAAAQWLGRNNWPQEPGLKGMLKNEKQAYHNFKLIIDAQEKYYKTDWNKDGKNEYAAFLVHLWKSIDLQSQPLSVGLISKKLGYAMGPSLAVSGYYFADLHKSKSAQGDIKQIDHEKAWAMVCKPETHDRTGRLIFIADNTGRVFARSSKIIPDYYPEKPETEDWTKISNAEDLASLQESLN